MTEKISLRVFWAFMLACAASALVIIWLPPHTLDERIIPTLFIPGLASFLIWLPLVAYRFLAK